MSANKKCNMLFHRLEINHMDVTIINPFFIKKIFSASYICYIYSDALQTYYITEANTMNPDQTAPKGAV